MQHVGTITTPLGNALAVLRDDGGRYWTEAQYEGEVVRLPVAVDGEAGVLALLPQNDGRRVCTVCGTPLSRYNTTTRCALHEGDGPSEAWWGAEYVDTTRCAACGEPLVPLPSHPNRRYCSTRCRKREWARRRSAANAG